jgi:hypothetical protein
MAYLYFAQAKGLLQRTPHMLYRIKGCPAVRLVYQQYAAFQPRLCVCGQIAHANHM